MKLRILFFLVFVFAGCKNLQSINNLAVDKNSGQSEIENPPEESSSTLPEMGGSNYAFIDLGRYAQNPTDENWFNDVKTPVVHFQEYREKVKEQLDFMIQNGQRKIALIVWFGGPNLQCETWAHTVCPQNGRLPQKVKNNLVSLIQEITSRKFVELQVRLATQGTADIYSWDSFKEDVFQSNSSFIFDVIDVVEDALGGKSIKIYYDLGLEQMGHPYVADRAWHREYLRRIWAMYIQNYDLNKTIGFSFNHAHRSGVIESLKIFEQSGKRPPRLGVDVYVDRGEHFQNLRLQLGFRGWGKNFPVYIQETYRNDQSVMADVLKARKDGLNILTIMQWPLDSGGSGHSNSADYPFDNYK